MEKIVPSSADGQILLSERIRGAVECVQSQILICVCVRFCVDYVIRLVRVFPYFALCPSSELISMDSSALELTVIVTMVVNAWIVRYAIMQSCFIEC